MPDGRAAGGREPRPEAEAPSPGLPFLWWEVAGYGGLVLLALVMRLWDLGGRALSHDEILHVWFSWQLFQGQGYAHSPMMHGTFQFHGQALAFFLFGDSLFAARLLPALFGTALVALPLFLRSHLGRVGALVAAALLAMSPSLLYYSRYARNDIYMAVWAVALVACVWRYLDTGWHRYLYLTSLFLALALVTKETSYILIAILGAYLFILAAGDLVRWAQRRLPLTQLSRPGVLFLVFFTLTLPHWSAGMALIQDLLPVTLATPEGDLRQVGLPEGAGWAVALALVGVLAVASIALGMRWNWRVWARCAALFYGVWGLLYTTFLTNLAGAGTGIWQSMGYWVAQQDVQRGDQPWYYYLVLAPLYETLAFLFLFIGVGYYLWRSGERGRRVGGWALAAAVVALLVAYALGGVGERLFLYLGVVLLVAAVILPFTLEQETDLFSFFLVFWATLTFLAYTLAGEKMPWLLVNVAVPLVLLAARFLGDLVGTIPWRRVGVWSALLLPLAVPLLVFFVARPLFVAPGARGLGFWATGVGALVLVGVMGYLVARVGPRHGAALVALGVAGVLFLFGLRSAVVASYFEDDIGKEMLVYAHSAPGILAMTREIDRLAEVSGKGKALSIAADNDDYWTWVWYLRQYPNTTYSCMNAPNCSVPAEADVVLVDERNRDHVEGQLDGFSRSLEAVSLWWFPEVYRGVNLGTLWRGLRDPEQRRQVMDFLLYRKLTPEALVSEKVYLHYRTDLGPAG